MSSVILATRAKPSYRSLATSLGLVGVAVLMIGVVIGGSTVATATTPTPTVNLGTATPFAVLAGSTVTNTGSSVISGDLGVSPTIAVSGFPPGQVQDGVQHNGDAVALQAQSDLTTAYGDAAGRSGTTLASAELGGLTLIAGAYRATSSLDLTGTVTLDGQGAADSVFIVQIGSTLTTASNATVSMINGAQACNVFWQVGSSATLGTDTTFVGSILALTSATLTTGASVKGRVLARNGAVTLDDNKITDSACAPTITSVTPSSGSTVGGTVITITGTGFSTASGGTTVHVGLGGSATNVVCATTTTCTASTPSGTAGSVPVTVTVGGQASPTPGAPPFTYITPSTPTTIAVNSVTTAPGTTPTTAATSVVGATTTTLSPAGVVGTGSIPTGAPETGVGGASRSRDGSALVIGGLALIGAGLAVSQAIRRRRGQYDCDFRGEHSWAEDE